MFIHSFTHIITIFTFITTVFAGGRLWPREYNSEQNKVPTLMELTFWWRETDTKQVNIYHV